MCVGKLWSERVVYFIDPAKGIVLVFIRSGFANPLFGESSLYGVDGAVNGWASKNGFRTCRAFQLS
jgi:hypothetical protein